MISIQNPIGKITISQEYLTELIGNTVTNCFGVVSMNVVGMRDTFLTALSAKKAKSSSHGVSVKFNKNKLVIDLHISLMYGVNMKTVVRSIIHKVGYTVEQGTGLNVEKVNVYVDSIRA